MSIGDAASGVPAGWYPDPADDARLRRWDGERWTPDVILAPQDQPVGFVPPAPTPTPSVPTRSVPTPTATFAAPPPTATFAPPPTPAPPASAPPPPPSAPPTAPPPGSASAPPTAPTTPPPPSAPVNPPSGPVSLPEWATLPGLTLPPDLSGIPGLEPEPVLKAPTFEEPRKSTLRAPDWNARPSFEDAPAVPPADHSHPTPARNYAPPPAGAQYDVPPPPGAVHAPAAGPVLPASALTAPKPPAAAVPVPPGPLALGTLPRASGGRTRSGSGTGGLTVWAWLIALLPAIQFGVVYLVFGALATGFQPGVQWGVLAAPAAFALLFAIADQRFLVGADVDRAPSPLLAIVAPIYLLARAIDVGRSSAVLLVVWIVLQAAAVAGVYYLLPDTLALAITSVG